jgi:hypothetical protein
MFTNKTTYSAKNIQSPITDASAPFNNAKADVILRSTDNVDFRVFKVLLSLASPFFDDMFGLPQGDINNDTKDGLPVVRMAEERKTLEMLLLMCYPTTVVDHSDLETLSGAHLVLEAANKYNMESVEKHLRACLVMPQFLDVDPLRVFAIACRCRFEAEAKLAAQATFGRPLSIEPYVPELELITAGRLHQLLQYHDSCTAPCKNIATDFTWIDNTSFFWFQGSSDNPTVIGPSRTVRNVQGWWLDYMRGVAAALENHTWNEDTRTSLMQTAQQAILKARRYEALFRAEFPEFIDMLMAKLREVICEVGLLAYFGLHPPYSPWLFTGSVGSSLLGRDIVRGERMRHRRKSVPRVLAMNHNDSSWRNVISSCIMYITIVR